MHCLNAHNRRTCIFTQSPFTSQALHPGTYEFMSRHMRLRKHMHKHETTLWTCMPPSEALPARLRPTALHLHGQLECMWIADMFLCMWSSVFVHVIMMYSIYIYANLRLTGPVNGRSNLHVDSDYGAFSAHKATVMHGRVHSFLCVCARVEETTQCENHASLPRVTLRMWHVYVPQMHACLGAWVHV